MVVDRFAADHNGLIMTINPLTPHEVLKDYIQRGRIDEVSLVRHSIASDIADQFGGASYEEAGAIEISIKPKRRGFFDKDGIMEVLEGARDIKSLYDLHDFHYDTIKTKVVVDGVTRTFDIVQPKRFRASVNVTRDVSVGADGHPDYNSLVIVSDSVIRGMARKAGIVL
ncbi:hypothetical protein [Azospirillum brasilense]|uniref:hypothetical protein n=1 Tax=Azospirillum brasilense TaxID=192 RepID=UPI001478640B|nr:hypothetical protein [Azospirillum brasilense]